MMVEINAKEDFLYRHAACFNYSLNNLGIFKPTLWANVSSQIILLILNQ